MSNRSKIQKVELSQCNKLNTEIIYCYYYTHLKQQQHSLCSFYLAHSITSYHYYKTFFAKKVAFA